MSSGQKLLVSLILEQRLCHCHVTAVSCQKQGGAASDSLSILFFKQKPSLSYIVRPFIKLRLRAKNNGKGIPAFIGLMDGRFL